jgi:hypothetical protein
MMYAAGRCVVKADRNDVNTVVEQYTHVIGAYEIQYKARRNSHTIVQAHSSFLPLALVLLWCCLIRTCKLSFSAFSADPSSSNFLSV